MISELHRVMQKLARLKSKVGIPPGWGGTQRMLRLLRVSKAKELIYTGRMVGADEAFQMGLVNKVVNIETRIRRRSRITG